MPQLSDFLFSASDALYGMGAVQGVAGEPLAPSDAVLLAANNKLYPVKAAATAAVSAQGATIFSPTSVTTTPSTTGCKNYHRDPLITLRDGSIVLLTYGGESPGNSGCKIWKYSADGLRVESLKIASTVSQIYFVEPCQDKHLTLLSDGNILISFAYNAYFYFTILGPSLNVIKATTTGEQLSGTAWMFDVCSLSGGGFAVTYNSSPSYGVAQRLAVYSNAGVLTTAPTTIYTYTATASTLPVYHRIGQLSNGNIAVVTNSCFPGGSGIGTYVGVYSTTAAIVKAMTRVASTGSDPSNTPDLSTLTGYFAIARGDQTSGFKVLVFDNGGTLQGSAFSPVSALLGYSTFNFRLINDGTQFWAIWYQSIFTGMQITKIPVTGAGYISTGIASSGSGNCPMDAFYERGFIVLAYMEGGTTPKFQVVLISNNVPSLAHDSTSYSTVSPAGNYSNASIFPVGDMSFAGFAIPEGIGACYLAAVKYTNASIIGWAQSGCASGETATIGCGAAAYPINPLKGSIPAKSFDHNASAIPGNKGTILTNGGLVLRGI